MLFYLFECGIRVFSDKVIKLPKISPSKYGFATLILRVWSDAALQFSSLPELLYPPSCNLKLFCNTFKAVLAGIISRQYTFS